MKNFDVLNIGIIVLDLLAKLPVKQVDFCTDSIYIPDMNMVPGGDAANVSTILAQLGKKVSLTGCVGDDLFGATVLGALKKRGVDVSRVKATGEADTSVSLVLINSTGDRTFITRKNRANNRFLRAEDFDTALLDHGRHLNVSSIFSHPLFEQGGGPALLKKAREKGLTTSADMKADSCGSGPESVMGLLEHLDIFMPSYAEAKYLTGENDPKRMARFLAGKTGEKSILIKLGEEGCFVHEPGREYTIPAFKVDALDTTGAGDTFVGGVISASLEGMPIEECVRYGSAAAAINVVHMGATTPNVTKENIATILQNTSTRSVRA